MMGLGGILRDHRCPQRRTSRRQAEGRWGCPSTSLCGEDEGRPEMIKYQLAPKRKSESEI